MHREGFGTQVVVASSPAEVVRGLSLVGGGGAAGLLFAESWCSREERAMWCHSLHQ